MTTQVSKLVTSLHGTPSSRFTSAITVVVVIILAQTAHGALQIHYSFDDGAGVATNSVGTNGTYSAGGTTYGAGIVGAQAADPDTYINTNIDLGTQTQYTMSFWYNTNTNQACCGNGGLYYTNGAWGAVGDELHSSLTNNSSQMWFQHHNGGQPTSGTVSGAVLNNWHHMVASYNAGQMTYTIDGVVGGPFGMDPSARLATGQIGAWNGTRIYIGQFDDWAIWTGESLSTAETTGIFNLANSTLNYNAQNADELFGVFNGETTSANIGGVTWGPAADGTLAGSAGDVLDLGGGAFALVLNGVGGGVQTLPLVVPEPSTFVLALLGLFSFGLLRRTRHRR